MWSSASTKAIRQRAACCSPRSRWCPPLRRVRRSTSPLNWPTSSVRPSGSILLPPIRPARSPSRRKTTTWLSVSWMSMRCPISRCRTATSACRQWRPSRATRSRSRSTCKTSGSKWRQRCWCACSMATQCWASRPSHRSPRKQRERPHSASLCRLRWQRARSRWSSTRTTPCSRPTRPTTPPRAASRCRADRPLSRSRISRPTATASKTRPRSASASTALQQRACWSSTKAMSSSARSPIWARGCNPKVRSPGMAVTTISALPATVRIDSVSSRWQARNWPRPALCSTTTARRYCAPRAPRPSTTGTSLAACHRSRIGRRRSTSNRCSCPAMSPSNPVSIALRCKVVKSAPWCRTPSSTAARRVRKTRCSACLHRRAATTWRSACTTSTPVRHRVPRPAKSGR